MFFFLVGMFQVTLVSFSRSLLTLVVYVRLLPELVSMEIRFFSKCGVVSAYSTYSELGIRWVFEVVLFISLEGSVTGLTRFIKISSVSMAIAESSAIRS